jgi:RNA polymerase sigma factor (sigma-70 family)
LNLNDQELIVGLKNGEEHAFHWLVNSHKDSLFRILFHILQNDQEAEDALQETFIKVYESIHTFRQESSLATWMNKIAVRKALGLLRKRKNLKRLQTFLPWWIPDDKKSINILDFHPEFAPENKEKAEAIFIAIASLPENQKIVFNLIRIQGMKYEEVSEIMGLGIKALESLMSRAKRNLQQKLENYYNL